MLDCTIEDIKTRLSKLLGNSFERLEGKFQEDIKNIEEIKYTYYDIYQVVLDGLETTDDEQFNENGLEEGNGLYNNIESSTSVYHRSKTPIGSKQKTERDKTPTSRKNTDRSKTPIGFDNGVKSTTSNLPGNLSRRLEERRITKTQREGSITDKKTETKQTKKSILSSENTKQAEKDVFERLYKQGRKNTSFVDNLNVTQSAEMSSFADTRKVSAKSTTRLRKKSMQDTSVEPSRNLNKNQSFISKKSNDMDLTKDIRKMYLHIYRY